MSIHLPSRAAITAILLLSAVGCSGDQWAFAPGAYPASGHYGRPNDSSASDGTSGSQAELPYQSLAPDPRRNAPAIANNSPAQGYAPAQGFASAQNNGPAQGYVPAQGYAPAQGNPATGKVMLASNTSPAGGGAALAQGGAGLPEARVDGTIVAPNEPGPTMLPPQQAAADPNAIQFAPTGPLNPPPASEQPVYRRPSLEDRCNGFLLRAWEDERNYYTWETAVGVGAGLSVDAVLAETPMDQRFRNWYQNDVRSAGTDGVAKFVKNFGEGSYMIPGAISLMVAGELLDQYPLAGELGNYGERITRAYIVGAVPFLALQYGLGAARPDWGIPNASQWRPFQNSYGVSASGHAFISSIPFLTAADMVDDPWLKGVFYLGSTFTGWSRINDDAHYLSEVILGWTMGYLSVRAVNHTELEQKSSFSMAPVVTPDMTGVAFNLRW
jgi:hypothetical protein